MTIVVTEILNGMLLKAVNVTALLWHSALLPNEKQQNSSARWLRCHNCDDDLTNGPWRNGGWRVQSNDENITPKRTSNSLENATTTHYCCRFFCAHLRMKGIDEYASFQRRNVFLFFFPYFFLIHFPSVLISFHFILIRNSKRQMWIRMYR